MTNIKLEKLIVILLAVVAIGWSAWFIVTQTTTISDNDMQTAGWVATPQPTPTPTPASTPTPEEPTSTPEPTPTPNPYEARAEEIMRGMSLEEKVWQLFISTPEEVAGVSPVTISGDIMEAELANYPVGGLLYDAQNFEDEEQIQNMLLGAQARSALGLFIACTEEGGENSLLLDFADGVTAEDALSYQYDGADTAYANAYYTANAMIWLGFNLDLAPVCDVYSNAENDIIGARAYSTDYNTAAELAAAAVRGFTDAGIITAVKHFPGIGDLSGDGLAVNKSLDELRENEFLPFVSAIDAGAGIVMVSTVTVPDVDNSPACLSYTWVTDILRGELGYTGVVSTTVMTDVALRDYSQGEAAVRAIQAGVDILLAPDNLAETGQAVLDAVDSGELAEDRINESVVRILELKLEYGIIS